MPEVSRVRAEGGGLDVVVEVVGWLGTALLLSAYALVSRGALDSRGARYQTLNVLGGALLGLNSVVHRAWPSVGINSVWLVIGTVALVTALRRRPARNA